MIVEAKRNFWLHVFLWIAQIILALLAAALILSMWLPIDGVRNWLTAHWPRF